MHYRKRNLIRITLTTQLCFVFLQNTLTSPKIANNVSLYLQYTNIYYNVKLHNEIM